MNPPEAGNLKGGHLFRTFLTFFLADKYFCSLLDKGMAQRSRKKAKDMVNTGRRYFLERFEKEEGYEKMDDLDDWRSDELIEAIYR